MSGQLHTFKTTNLYKIQKKFNSPSPPSIKLLKDFEIYPPKSPVKQIYTHNNNLFISDSKINAMSESNHLSKKTKNIFSKKNSLKISCVPTSLSSKRMISDIQTTNTSPNHNLFQKNCLISSKTSRINILAKTFRLNIKNNDILNKKLKLKCKNTITKTNANVQNNVELTNGNVSSEKEQSTLYLNSTQNEFCHNNNIGLYKKRFTNQMSTKNSDNLTLEIKKEKSKYVINGGSFENIEDLHLLMVSIIQQTKKINFDDNK